MNLLCINIKSVGIFGRIRKSANTHTHIASCVKTILTPQFLKNWGFCVLSVYLKKYITHLFSKPVLSGVMRKDAYLSLYNQTFRT